MSATGDKPEWLKRPAIGAVLAVGGALVYGLVVFTYGQFYAELGVRPAEVGLQYGPGAGGSAGVAAILAVVLLASIPVGLLGRVTGARTGTWRWAHGLFWFLGGFAVIMVLVTRWLLGIADDNADRVKNGLWVEPVKILHLELVSFRADLATVAAASRKPAPEVAALSERDDELLYLGRSAGVVVLYDSFQHMTYHVPAAAITLRARNCETRYRDRLACSGQLAIRRRQILRVLADHRSLTDGQLSKSLWDRDSDFRLRPLTQRLKIDNLIDRAKQRDRWKITGRGRRHIKAPAGR